MNPARINMMKRLVCAGGTKVLRDEQRQPDLSLLLAVAKERKDRRTVRGGAVRSLLRQKTKGATRAEPG